MHTGQCPCGGDGAVSVPWPLLAGGGGQASACASPELLQGVASATCIYMGTGGGGLVFSYAGWKTS